MHTITDTSIRQALKDETILGLTEKEFYANMTIENDMDICWTLYSITPASRNTSTLRLVINSEDFGV